MQEEVEVAQLALKKWAAERGLKLGRTTARVTDYGDLKIRPEHKPDWRHACLTRAAKDPGRDTVWKFTGWRWGHEAPIWSSSMSTSQHPPIRSHLSYRRRLLNSKPTCGISGDEGDPRAGRLLGWATHTEFELTGLGELREMDTLDAGGVVFLYGMIEVLDPDLRGGG